ncbi:phosphatase PAP2 family protein [Kocuria palustris]|uniref:phosphatase PAP2 family protein n=1 Tax=Kocuria palustris TaxID=71999 RepID=UPI0011A50ABC|nr:phosphatase PAP2 family protein [Kocuria palustris]
MTYIPAEDDPQRGRGEAVSSAGRPHRPRDERRGSSATRVLPVADAARLPQHGAADDGRPAWAPQPERRGSHVEPMGPAQHAPLRPRPSGPARGLDARSSYPGQAVYHYGGGSRPERRRDLSLGIAVAHLIRAGLLFALAALLSWAALRTVSGQWVDEAALQQAAAVHDRLPGSATGLLGSATLLTCLAAGVVAVALAAAHRRWVPLVVALCTAVPALLSVQVLKHGLLDKTAYGIQDAAQNSLPSGHTAAAAAAAAVVVMVAPARTRKLWALLGTLAVTAAGVGTVINGWHRPTDAAVSVLIVAGWFVLGSLLLRALVPAEPWVPQRGLTLLLLTLAGIGLTALALTAQQTVPAPGLALAFGALAVLTVSLFSAHQLVRAMRPRRR